VPSRRQITPNCKLITIITTPEQNNPAFRQGFTKGQINAKIAAIASSIFPFSLNGKTGDETSQRIGKPKFQVGVNLNKI
jgi:hypothetical protein